MSSSPPGFWTVAADAIRMSAEQRGFRAWLPWWFVLTTIVPTGLYHYFVDGTISIGQPADGAAAFATIAVIGAFLGSVSISTMVQVQKIVCTYPFSDYLRHEKVFDVYLFWPQFVLWIQLMLVVTAGISSFVAFIGVASGFLDELLVFNAGFLLYAVTKTWLLIEMLRTLAWHQEEYTRLDAEYKNQL